MADILNNTAFVARLKAELNASMTQAAEPVIQDALKAFEKGLRQKVSEFVLAQIETRVSLESMVDHLIVRVEYDHSPKMKEIKLP